MQTTDEAVENFIRLCYSNAIFLKVVKEMLMIFPNEIKKLRTRCFLTQEEFAKKLGMAFSIVNRWEQVKSKPLLVVMKNIKAFCKENDIAYNAIEDAWLKYKVGGKEQ